MKLIKLACLFLQKIVMAVLLIWLWSTSASAYDFTLTCYGPNGGHEGKCGKNQNFVLTKTSDAHDGVTIPLPLSYHVGGSYLYLYLASCTSDTSCELASGIIYQKPLGVQNVSLGTWGNASKLFLDGVNRLRGTFSPASAFDQTTYWDYGNLCLSITVVNYTTTWYIWGLDYGVPMNTVRCSVPINRVAADTCSATTPSIDVAFGEIERAEISTQAGGIYDKTKSFTLNCTGGSAHNFLVTLNMTPVSWSPSQMVTSNPALGVSMSKDGVPIHSSSAFIMNVPAGGSDVANLVFSLLKNPSIPASNIATGDFTASATLIVTEI